MKRIIVIFLGAFLLYSAACDENELYGDYLGYFYIDTVLVGDTIQNDELVRVVHGYPRICTYLERIESRERGDTLELAALFHFISPNDGEALCPPRTRPDSVSFSLHFSAGGMHYLSYLQREKVRIDQPVYVEE
jgi:hypothetical protein